MYQVKKRITGFSTCFRQHRAKSHCKFLHGYALEFVLTFECEELNDRNWVIDFGSFTPLKNSMKDRFDHTTIVAGNDPRIKFFYDMRYENVMQLRVMDAVGCEAFAEWVYVQAQSMCEKRVKLISVECIENENNSAIYKP